MNGGRVGPYKVYTRKKIQYRFQDPINLRRQKGFHIAFYSCYWIRLWLYTFRVRESAQLHSGLSDANLVIKQGVQGSVQMFEGQPFLKTHQ